MTSFLSRMANEASAALSDAYGHVVHGDDAGSSAKVVWVVHPTKVPIDINHHLGEGATGTNKQQGGKEDPTVTASPGRNAMSSSYLFTQKFDLGLTFLEINDRAYVRTVDPGSLAEKAGIQPQDCVQFACVVGGPHFEDLEQSQSSSANSGNIRRSNSSRIGVEGSRRDENENKALLESKATKFVLECEKRGMRSSYEELRDLFAGCTLPPKGDGSGAAVAGNITAKNGGGGTGANNKNDKNSLITPPRTAAGPSNSKVDDDFTIGSNSLLMADSVGGMFETTKRNTSKHNISSRRVPTLPDKKIAVKNVTLNVTNAARNAAGRCFDAQDMGDGDMGEGSEFGEDGKTGGGGTGFRSRKSSQNNLLLDTPLSPIKSDNVISPSSPTRGGRAMGSTFGDSVVEQSLWPVVMVFRRTVQRKRMLTTGGIGNVGKWGSMGLSLKGSLFGIPSFRMDDECDRAAALIRQLAPSRSRSPTSNKGKGSESNIFFSKDDDHSQAPTVTSNGPGDPRSPDVDENIEASTIRGMIGAAVGLGFVRLSKVVVGVSLQGGSGILISRLPDGTWSAPSAMGVYGLGVGLQFGLEVADFMFIIQTQEGMEHFKRGGNFVVGGNIGAAMVNCGREAYGAASLGVCTGPLPLEEGTDDMLEDATVADTVGGGDDRDDNTSAYDESTYQSNASTMRNTSGNNNKQSSKKKDSDIAPMVAYAKSQGLYFGVSVDGLKFFTRNDINARTYKFSMLSEMPAKDILSGLVMPPPEAEDLYSALHSVEFTHEMTELPRPPEMLRRDSMKDWRYDRSICAMKGEIIESNSDSDKRKYGNHLPLYSFLDTLDREEADQFSQFETKFKKFLYGGVSVQHLLPHHLSSGGSGRYGGSGMTRREKRTLWLMLPEVGSLRLGFVSKLKDGGDDASVMDDITVASSVASSRAGEEDILPSLDNAGNVKLSNKYSVSLTDIKTLSQDPNVTIRLSPDDATEHLRILSINDVTGKSMLFLANSNREAELLFCGLKLLLECETARLGVRGGVPLDRLGGKLGKGALSPVSARGSLKSSSARGSNSRRDRLSDMRNSHRHHNAAISRKSKDDLDDRSKYSSFGEPGTSSDESAGNDEMSKDSQSELAGARIMERHQVPEGRESWSQLPGRNKMRQMASGASASPQRGEQQVPQHQLQAQAPMYELGKAVCTDIATNVSLPLPLALCRVLFLDSSSPVNRSWEAGRADSDYRHGAWAFPPGSTREFEHRNGAASSEHELISRGPMSGAQRTISYSRTRNRELVRLSETVAVEQDNLNHLVFTVTDQMPRRGFSARARIFLRSFGNQGCEARIVTEIRPVGKNLSNQQAVHKAFILVLDEMKKRYGIEEKGLLAVFLDVYHTLPGYGGPTSPASHNQAALSSRRSQHASTGHYPPNGTAQSASFKSIPENNVAKTTDTRSQPRMQGNNNRSPGINNMNGAATPKTPSPSKSSSQRSSSREKRSQNLPERPSTPSIRTIDSKTVGMPTPTIPPKQFTPITPDTGNFADFSDFDDIPRNPVTVEVKPLPKIRLDLCPVPREEDEEENSTMSGAEKQKRKSGKHSKSSKHSKQRQKHRKSKTSSRNG